MTFCYLDSRPLLEGQVEPFVLPPGFEPSYSDKGPSLPPQGSAAPLPHGKFASYTSSAPSSSYTDIPSTSYNRGYPPAPSEAPTRRTSTFSDMLSGSNSASAAADPIEASRDTPSARVRQELDAGPVRDEEPEVILPPGYNPEWSSSASFR